MKKILAFLLLLIALILLLFFLFPHVDNSKTFGYYPTTVGAWWIGADSLVYMQQKYGITAAMKAADQHGLDVYTIWGSPWNIPYVSSKENEGIPATTVDTGSKVVIAQWAARDPLQAYGAGQRYGTFSTQDYEIKNYDISYFDYLLGIYLQKPLDQMIVGIENSPLSAFAPTSHYPVVLSEVATLRDEGKLQIDLEKNYAKKFLDKKITLAPTHMSLTKDFATDDQSFWYTTPNYQISLQKRGNSVYLVDLRNYANKQYEDFYTLPNSQPELLVNTPAIADSATFQGQKWLLGNYEDNLQLTNKNGTVTLTSGNKTIATLTANSAKIITFKNPLIFTHPSHPLTAYSLLVIVFLIYIVIFFLLTRNVKQTVLFFLCIIPIMIAYPFLSPKLLMFDKKQLMLSPFFLIAPTIPYVHITLLQVFPFLLLPIVHLFSNLLKRYWVYPIYVVFLCAVFLHLPYFPLDHSTYKIVGLCIFVIFLICAAVAGFVILKRPTSKTIGISLSWVLFITATVINTILFSRSMETITSFEMDALQIVYSQKKPVVYVQPPQELIYKAVRPALYDDISFAQRLTNVSWKNISRNSKNNLSLPDAINYVVVVPRYLGSQIYPEEIEKYHLQKIFDNLEIAVFKKY